MAALAAGDRAESKPLLEEALRVARQIDDRVVQFCLISAYGCHAALDGRARLAARLLGAAETMRVEAGANVMPFLAPMLAHAEESAAAALGAARFAAESEAGKRLDRDAALALAAGKSADGAATAKAAAAPATTARAAATGNVGAGLLGKREADVARLVADGLTNRQIGVRLFISERTVDSHVRNILVKLGASSRAQIAAWIASPDQ